MGSGTIVNELGGGIYGDATAIRGTLANVSIYNLGAIRAPVDAVVLDAGGMIINHAQISVSASSTGDYAVSISGAAGTVINTSVISSLDSDGGGIFLGAGGSVSNDGFFGTIDGDLYAIVARAAPATVTNSRSIIGRQGGIGLFGGGLVSNASGGYIAGTNAAAGIYALGPATVTNAAHHQGRHLRGSSRRLLRRQGHL